MNKVWVAADGKRFMKRITRTTFRKRKTKLSVRNHISINQSLWIKRLSGQECTRTLER